MKHPCPILLCCLALAACGKAPETASKALPPVPVEARAVETRTVPYDLAAIGAVEPMASVQLKSKVQGEIMAVHFADGSVVQAGATLFSIDPRPFEAALKRAQANLATAQAESVNAEEQAKRYTTLINRGSASREQFAQFLTTAETMKSTLAARQADLDEAQLSLDWTQVKAPISGRTGAALLKPGNIVQANTEVLTIINQMQPIYVTFALPEQALDDIRRRMQDARPQVTAREPDSGAVLGTGELTFVDNAVDRASGMVTFKATFPNEDEKLWPGRFVDVSVRLGEQENALVVPSTAIMEGQQGASVFVVQDGVAKLRPVRVERSAGGDSVIEHGLEAGELVVTSGQLRVASGAKVAVKEAPPTTASNDHPHPALP